MCNCQFGVAIGVELRSLQVTLLAQNFASYILKLSNWMHVCLRLECLLDLPPFIVKYLSVVILLVHFLLHCMFFSILLLKTCFPKCLVNTILLKLVLYPIWYLYLCWFLSLIHPCNYWCGLVESVIMLLFVPSVVSFFPPFLLSFILIKYF